MHFPPPPCFFLRSNLHVYRIHRQGSRRTVNCKILVINGGITHNERFFIKYRQRKTFTVKLYVQNYTYIYASAHEHLLYLAASLMEKKLRTSSSPFTPATYASPSSSTASILHPGLIRGPELQAPGRSPSVLSKNLEYRST